MREILFRMYDGVKMVYDGLVIYNGELYEDWRAFEDGIKSDNPLMQYTGLDDKNGVKIFEGDIVREHVNDYTPIYQNGIYMAYNVDKINDPYVSTQFNVIWRNGCEVIGNVHDNPELMEEGVED